MDSPPDAAAASLVPEPAGRSGPRPQANAAPERPWRELLAERSARLGLVATAFGAGVVLALLPDARLIAGFSIALPLLWLGAWPGAVPAQVRSSVVVAAFTVIAFAGYSTVGFLSGPASVLSLALLLGGLLLGRISLVVLVGSCAAALAAVAWLNQSGVLAIDQSALSVYSARAWLRTSMITFLTSVTAVSTVSWVVRRLEGALLASREEARRREVAEASAARAQKIELIGRMAAGIAHDFNNVLSVIVSWNELLSHEAKPDGPRPEGHQAIHLATEKAMEMVRRLLVTGRQDTGAPRQLALRGLLETVGPLVSRTMPAGVTFDQRCDGDPFAFVDEGQVTQVILNLAVNARDAMKGRGRFTLRARPVQVDEARPAAVGLIGPGRWSVLEAEDDGSGMDSATQEKAFEPFFTTKPPGKGTGLGLATVAWIAERAGGAVTLDSRPGLGTRIALWFPAGELPPG